MRKLFLLTILMVMAIGVVASSTSSYDKIVGQMENLANTYPQYVQIMNIGSNDQGLLIKGMRMENTAYSQDYKPAQLLVGCHHGNEGKSVDVSMEFAEQLLDIFKNSNHKLHKGLSASVFYVIPVLNISGYNVSNRREKSASGSWLDPNRDYPDPCAKNSYFQLASTRNLAQFVEKYNIVGAITIHGYIGTFTYPWGIYTSNTKTADHDLYRVIAQKCCEVNNYRYGTHTDVIYPAVGAFEDWCYCHYGCWTMLMELSRYCNLEKDAECMLVYFTLIPTERSKDHAHKGKCTATMADDTESRP